jgi:hypothetical protein
VGDVAGDSLRSSVFSLSILRLRAGSSYFIHAKLMFRSNSLYRPPKSSPSPALNEHQTGLRGVRLGFLGCGFEPKPKSQPNGVLWPDALKKAASVVYFSQQGMTCCGWL